MTMLLCGLLFGHHALKGHEFDLFQNALAGAILGLSSSLGFSVARDFSRGFAFTFPREQFESVWQILARAIHSSVCGSRVSPSS